MKNKKGITLIALVITIIVMLILVGVTINVAINGGLFEEAGYASKEAERQAIYEQIIGMSEFDSNGRIDVGKTFARVQQEFGNKVSTLGADGKFTVEGKLGTYTYKLTTEKISIIGDESNSSYKAYISTVDGLIVILDSDDNLYAFEGNGEFTTNSEFLVIDRYTIPEIETAIGGLNYVSNGVLELDTTTQYRALCMTDGNNVSPVAIYYESDDSWYAGESSGEDSFAFDTTPLLIPYTGDISNIIQQVEDIKTPRELTDLEKFILGENGTGRPVSQIYDFQNGVFLNDSSNRITNASTKVTLDDSQETTTSGDSEYSLLFENVYIIYKPSDNENAQVYKTKIYATDSRDQSTFTTLPISTTYNIYLQKADFNIYDGVYGNIADSFEIDLYENGIMVFEMAEQVKVLPNSFQLNDRTLSMKVTTDADSYQTFGTFSPTGSSLAATALGNYTLDKNTNSNKRYISSATGKATDPTTGVVLQSVYKKANGRGIIAICDTTSKGAQGVITVSDTDESYFESSGTRVVSQELANFGITVKPGTNGRTLIRNNVEYTLVENPSDLEGLVTYYPTQH